MNRKILLLGAILCALLMAVPAVAQNFTVVRATVPFDFWMGEQKFPAGNYVFNISDQTKTIEVNQVGVTTHQYISSRDETMVTTAKESKLVFYRQRDRYTLHQIIQQGDGHVHDVGHGIQVVDVQ